MARPRAKLPDNQIAYLGRQGLGAPSILSVIKAACPGATERTVGNRLAELRAAGWPGADDYAKTVRPLATEQPTDSPPEGVATDASIADDVDIDHLPAELLTLASRDTFGALREALRRGEVVAADKLATVLERFARRLVEVRPPEKIDPVKDPTNVSARREILDRWNRLREPYEIAAPMIDQLQAHVDALRARLDAQNGAPLPADAPA